ncbi:MAG: hypothetical protein H7210_08875, partial [Pyrinomonadaceae bacterium]|nr:hypothetical protein [Phycisphaerales bacterium]
MVNRLSAHERLSNEDLFSMVYGEICAKARAILQHDPMAASMSRTELVHQVYVNLFSGASRGSDIPAPSLKDEPVPWKNRAHFFGAAAEAMRRILIENARRKSRLKRGADQVRVDIDHVELAATSPEEKVLLIDEALE